MTREEARALKAGDKIVVARKDRNGCPKGATIGKEYVVEQGRADLVFKGDDNFLYTVQAWLPQLERAPAFDFDPAWPHGHVTRDGRKARVICTDAKGPLPVVALIRDYSDDETLVEYHLSGSLLSGGRETESDLFNAPAPRPEPIVERRWMRKYKSGTFGLIAQQSRDHFCVPRDAVRVEIRELRDDERPPKPSAASTPSTAKATPMRRSAEGQGSHRAPFGGCSILSARGRPPGWGLSGGRPSQGIPRREFGRFTPPAEQERTKDDRG